MLSGIIPNKAHYTQQFQVVAARLTENPNVTVGVLEAGTSKLGDMLVDCPALFLQMFGKPEYDWNFKSVPQVITSRREKAW